MTISIGNTALTYIGNVQHQKSITELGQGGISVSSLSFDTIYPLPASAQTAAAVTCDVIPNITFYINSRTRNGRIVHVEALDAAAFLDQEIQLANQDISQDADGNKYVSAAVIQTKIAANCKNLSAQIPCTPTSYGFPLDYVQGKTFQQILTDISEVCAGFYTVTTNGLELKYLNEMDAVSSRVHHTVTYHSTVNVDSDFEYQCIAVQSSYETAYIGSNLAADYNTLTINNPLSDYVFPVYDAVDHDTGAHYSHVDTSSTPNELSGIANTKTFQGWTCENAVLTAIPTLGDYADFQTGEELRITDISIRFVGSEMIASMGGGIPTSGEISRRSRRQIELDGKLTIGEALGNMVLTTAPYNSGLKYYEQPPTQLQSGGGS